MHHRRKLRARHDAARVEQRRARHQQTAGAHLRKLDRGREVRVDALAVARELGELLADALMHSHARLHGVRVRDPDEKVSEAQMALHEREHAVAMQRRSDVRGGACVTVEEHVLPGDLDIFEDDHRVDLVEAAGERVVRGGQPSGEARAADVPDTGRGHVGQEADR